MNGLTRAQERREQQMAAYRNTSPRTMAMNLDIGAATDEVDVYEQKGAKVTVTRHEHGWMIVGGSTIWWESDGETPWSQFTAEIGDCMFCNSTSPHARIRPVCTTWHASFGTELPEKHKRDYCHEPGHVQRVRALAERTLRSY